MNNKIYTLLIVISVLACSQANNQKLTQDKPIYEPKGDTLTLIINKKKNALGALSYTDRFDNTVILYKNDNPIEENIVKRFYIADKDIIVFNKFPFFTPCLVYPKDTIIITYSENNQPPSFQNTKYSSANNPYNIFTLLSKTKSSIIDFEFTQLLYPKKSKKNIENELTEKYKANINFVDSVAKITSNNDEYYTEIKKILKYNFIGQSLYLQQTVLTSNDVKQYKEIFDVEKDINLPPYRQTLFEILFYSINKRLPTLADSLIATYDSANSVFYKPNIKEAIQFKCISLLKNEDKQKFDKQKAIFISSCTDSNFKNYLNLESITFKNTKGNNSIICLFNISKSESLDDKLKLDSGKVILIDLWASWCIPCRYEFNNSKKIISSYSSMPIAFYFVSIDENINLWKTASVQESIDTYSKSYLLLDFNSSKLKTQFNITSIPRYILIGKDGKVISADAPRPSDPKLKILIDKYINQ